MGVLKGGVSTTEVIVDEVATGTIDGANVVFTTSNDYISGSISVFLNGLQQLRPDDYSETSSNSFTFTNAPVGGADPDVVTVRYTRLS